ncbi:nuclear transport factor 2 family protein [Psychroserpens sp. SPM9]|uniref:nuclear transport factor 2 family protein n=1 Tax=Psychroserpens sp. SPM9 TaxID=2975598 RepID=UPI0021A37ADB|nr:nuclear transport factor 2 family protein [Psychroserpens sp. SPM9]MDG5491473.1 nuclear transport factor 2 family protein [Psychroserpens sp. SPM9]
MDVLIEKFYKAFSELDAETMASCYHDDIVFEDPAFGVLKGKRAGNMWRMLCQSQKGKDFKVFYSNIQASNTHGSASWEAFYIFSKTGRNVHNTISATFEFKDGKIIKHTDDFNLRKWAKQALGFKGAIIGGTRYFKTKLKHQTNRLLTKFETEMHGNKKAT